MTADQERLHIFAAYAELEAAEGIDGARVQRAWQRLQRLQTLVPKRNGKYLEQQLDSDYAWADPTAAMERAERIAVRNR